MGSLLKRPYYSMSTPTACCKTLTYVYYNHDVILCLILCLGQENTSPSHEDQSERDPAGLRRSVREYIVRRDQKAENRTHRYGTTSIPKYHLASKV